MPYYSDELIEEVRSRNDIVDVIGSYVRLKKKGSTYFGLCPFHNEKTGSFSVSPNKQIYYCFGCGAGGNVFTFLMQYENFTFGEAMQSLADRVGIELPQQEMTSAQRREADRRTRLLEINKEAAKYFYTLLRSPRGQKAYQYFKKRELSDETMQKFGLGYSDQYSDDLYRYLRKKGYDDDILKDSGLITIDEVRGGHDKFWNRAMFPIMDVHNRVIGFGGRVMGDGEPKYLNSPETRIFDKSRNLYGLNIARTTRKNQLLLCEGYMDVIALHQAGFDSAVASLGTSLTEEQARLLSRYTKNVIICYDADNAGQNAAQRAIDILGRAGLSVRVLRIPGAKDPDEFIKEHGAEAFRKLIERSENHIMYRLQNIQDKYDLTQDDQRVLFLKEAAREVASLENAVEREVYTARAAKTAGVTAQAFSIEVKNETEKRRRFEKKRYQREVRAAADAAQPKDRSLHYDNIRSARAEEGLLGLIFADSSLIPELRELITPAEFSSPLLGKLYARACRLFDEGHQVAATALEQEMTSGEMDHLAMVLRKPVPGEKRSQAMRDYVNVIRSSTAEDDPDSLLRIAARKRKQTDK